MMALRDLQGESAGVVSGLERKKRIAIRVARAVVGAACAVLSWTSPAQQDLAANPVFTQSEIRIILSHGPWPALAPPDPSNRVSGQADAIEFGTRLFFDQRLSAKGTVACASCHVPERNWSDNLARGVGMSEVDRNTPTLVNLTGSRWYGWDGASDSLWSQSLRPILDERELAATPRHVAQLVRDDEQLACRYRKAFGTPPSPTDDEAVLVGVGKALAAFQETLVSGRTPFDRFRDALAGAGRPPIETYSEPAQRGLKIFIGKGGCTTCHSGPNFTGGEFFNTGLSKFAPRGQPDPGRQAGIRRLMESRFNLLGPYNDDKTGASAARTREASLEKASFGEFKVPSLRNLILTAPYGRDGGVETLAEVVRHYADLDPVSLHAKDGRPAKPIALTPREQTDLIVFLQSLSTFSNPWRPDDGGECR
jgi:cytochrome c peroxidase